MMYRWSRSLVAWSLVCAAAFVVSGCHKNSVPGPSGSPTPIPSGTFPGVTTTTSVTLNINGGSVQLASTGLSETLAYPANSGGTGTLTLTTIIPVLPGTPTGTPLVVGELQLNSNVVFTNSYFWISSVTLPPSLFIPTLNNQFTETVYDSNAQSQIGNAVTGNINGQTINFPTIGTGGFTASLNDLYLFVISYQ